MPFPLSSECEFQTLYEALSPESRAVLMATNRQLRSSVQSSATSMTLTSILDFELLTRRCWPQLVKLKLTDIKDMASTGRLCSILAAGSFTCLQQLDVSSVPLTAEAKQQLAQGHWPVLTSLDLSGSFTTPDGHRSRSSVMAACKHLVAGKWSRLAVIKLADNDLNGRNVKDLFRKPWPALTSLDLSGNFASSVIDGLATADLKHLQMLNLSRCCVSAFHATAPALFSALFSVVHWPHLVWLDLSYAPIAVENIRLLSECSWPMLAYLALTHNRLEPGYTAYLARGRWPQLAEL